MVCWSHFCHIPGTAAIRSLKTLLIPKLSPPPDPNPEFMKLGSELWPSSEISGGVGSTSIAHRLFTPEGGRRGVNKQKST